MISVSDRSRVAVASLVELASRGSTGPVPILEVAERRGIPAHQVEQVFAVLRRAGLLESQRGVKGGYTLRRDPGDITVLDIIEAVDGPVGGDGLLPDSAIGEIWSDGARRLADAFGEVTVAEVAVREAQRAQAPMFHI